MWLDACINLILGLADTKYVTHGDQRKEGHALTGTNVFLTGMYVFLP